MVSRHYLTIAAVVLAFLLAAIAVRIAHAVVRRLLDALDIVDPKNRVAVQARATQLVRALTMLAYGVAALASISIALTRFGIYEARWDPRSIARWFATHGINAVV